MSAYIKYLNQMTTYIKYLNHMTRPYKIIPVFPVSQPTLILFPQIKKKLFSGVPVFSRNWSIVLRIAEEFFNRKTIAAHMLCLSQVVAMQFKECCHMGPINTISRVATRRTLKEVFEEQHGEMPKTGFILDVKCQVRDGEHYQINECLSEL